jgi:hypothetical protein
MGTGPAIFNHINKITYFSTTASPDKSPFLGPKYENYFLVLRAISITILKNSAEK